MARKFFNSNNNDLFSNNNKQENRIENSSSPVFGKNTKLNKVDRYNWIMQDEPGNLEYIDKNIIIIEESYQRDSIYSKVMAIASNWSWAACGTLTIGKRIDGKYVCIDGQHRLRAALNRSDITLIPCNVFSMKSVSDEARSFVASNINRKQVEVKDRFRAMIVSGDELSIKVSDLLKELGLKIATGGTNNDINAFRSINWCMKYGKENFQIMSDVLKTAHLLSKEREISINYYLLVGLHYIHKNIISITEDKKFRSLLFKVGAVRLLDGEKSERALSRKSGDKVSATGMIREINYGRRSENHYSIPA